MVSSLYFVLQTYLVMEVPNNLCRFDTNDVFCDFCICNCHFCCDIFRCWDSYFFNYKRTNTLGLCNTAFDYWSCKKSICIIFNLFEQFLIQFTYFYHLKLIQYFPLIFSRDLLATFRFLHSLDGWQLHCQLSIMNLLGG